MNRALRRLASALAVALTALPHDAPRAAEPGTVPAGPTYRNPTTNPLTEELLRKSPEEIERDFAGKTMPEAVKMVVAAHRVGTFRPGSGWYGPAASRYSWEWLAKRHGISPKSAIAEADFRGEPALFASLDRDGDGRIAADDFDWSESNPWVEQSYFVFRQLKIVDGQGDGRLDRTEWQAFFDRMAAGRETITTRDMLRAFRGAALPKARGEDVRSVSATLRGVVSGDIGSPFEGPGLDETAPDFALKTYDGKRTIRLSETVGPKPVVLVLGNYTCGRFRTILPDVEDVATRYRDRYEFLVVYVREAHAADGSSSGLNRSKGIEIVQPRTYDERVAVATRCGALLKTSLPLVVDTLDDATGHAYSGMPARFYIVDRQGKIAFKSGRGPFGYRPAELEQHLAMHLLDTTPGAAAVPADRRAP